MSCGSLYYDLFTYKNDNRHGIKIIKIVLICQMHHHHYYHMMMVYYNMRLMMRVECLLLDGLYFMCNASMPGYMGDDYDFYCFDIDLIFVFLFFSYFWAHSWFWVGNLYLMEGGHIFNLKGNDHVFVIVQDKLGKFKTW